MQAQTVTTRQGIRIGWLPLLVAALLVAALVLGTSIAMRGDSVTRAPRTGQTIGPKDLSGPTAYPGFVPAQKIPTQHVAGSVQDAPRHDSVPVLVAPNGRPLP
jgi:hypothetical protein